MWIRLIRFQPEPFVDCRGFAKGLLNGLSPCQQRLVTHCIEKRIYRSLKGTVARRKVSSL